MPKYYVTLTRQQHKTVVVQANSHEQAREFGAVAPDTDIVDWEADHTWDISNSLTEKDYFA